MMYIPPPMPPQTSVPIIGYESIYDRLTTQIPHWFGNQHYQGLPFFGGTDNTNFNIFLHVMVHSLLLLSQVVNLLSHHF